MGRRFVTTVHPAGAGHYRDHGVALPEPTLDACRRAHAILFGAMGLPDVRTADGTEYRSWAVLLALGSTYRRLGVPGEEALDRRHRARGRVH